MGSGKSTVGLELAKQLDQSYIDTDTYIEMKYGNIPDIFQQKGEETFRLYEIKTLKETTKYQIISTGGGIVEKQENYQTMKTNGVIIYLHTSFKEIVKRLGKDANRPLWNKSMKDKENLYKKRIPLYKEFSDYIVQTDQKTVQELVQEIIELINSRKDN